MNAHGIREGMTVYSSDGEKLGRVISCDADGFTVEKGFFFPKEHYARYDAVGSVQGDEAWLTQAKSMLGDSSREGWTGTTTTAATAGGLGAADLGSTHDRTRGSDELHATVAEEQLDVVKRERQAGEVRLRKEVVTETKHIEVPVMREEVRVERVPVDAPRTARAGEASFREETLSMPLVEEEVEIRKRPVIKEEVRVKRQRVEHEQRADAEVRREEVHVEDASTTGTTRGDRDLGTGLGAPSRDDDLIR